MINNKYLSNQLCFLEFYRNLNNFLKNKNKIDDEVLEWLHCNFSEISLDALNIIDKYKIKKVISLSNHFLYIIEINKSEKVVCLPELNYCSCDKFITDVIVCKKENICAHLLSSTIANNIPININEITLSNEEFSKILMSI